MPAVLGCIADDLTGGTDLAGMLAADGMRTVQMVGLPDGAWPDDADAVVVALKTRTVPVDDAVAASLAALDWLVRAGCRQYFFKYCSTFDSTPRGNIGPVARELLERLGETFTVACPAFPETGRTVYQGHLFVGTRLLHESGMEHHPLTPMRDADLVRVLQQQMPHDAVGLVAHDVVARGTDAIHSRFGELITQGVRVAVVDAISDADLRAIGRASKSMRLLTGGSGLARGLGDNFREARLIGERRAAARVSAAPGGAAVIAGSASSATRGQVARMLLTHPGFRVDPFDIERGRDVAADALAWAAPHLGVRPVLVYATAAPDDVRRAQEALGVERAAALVEHTLSDVAVRLVDAGVRQMIVAGGETAGAVLGALGARRLAIGPQIDPGVPWTTATLADGRHLALALKSGNFGGEDFFLRAWTELAHAS